MLEIRHWLTGEVIRIIDRYADLFVLPDIDASGETAVNLKSILLIVILVVSTLI